MPSHHRKIHKRQTFSASAPHFLQIIRKDNCRQTKLRLPKNFLKKYGDDLSNPVFLKVPSGSEWKIELRRWDGEVWVGKGWQKFFEFYSLDNCHSLVFGYEGNSKFRVRIFGRHFAEIHYPLTMPHKKETDDDDDSGDESSGDSSDGSDDDSSDDSDDGSGGASGDDSGKVEFLIKTHGRGTSSTPRILKRTRTVLGTTHPSNTGRRATALQRAKAFKSDKPSFIVAMQHSYIKAYSMWLPFDFNIHMPRLSKYSGDVMLRVLDGRTWSVELKYEKAAKPKARIQSGWHKFVQDNNLRIGDVCVFVLIDDARVTFKVVIFRSREAANTLRPDVVMEQTMPKMEETDEDDDSVEILEKFSPCLKPRKKYTIGSQPYKKNKRCSVSTAENKVKDVGSSSRTQQFLKHRPEVPRKSSPVTASNRALQRANAFKSEYPACTVIMHPSYIRNSYLYLGAKFTKEHLLKRTLGTVILSVPDGRTWPVQVGKQIMKNKVRFQSGWMTFVQDNNLEVGDVCVFVLIDDIKSLIKVVIFRAGETAKCTLSRGNRSLRTSSSRQIKLEAD